MTKASVSQTWEPSDTEVFTRYGDVFVPRRREQIEAVCDLLDGIPIPHVLDVCCGAGLLSEEYLRRADDTRVTIMDRSLEMLTIAEERLAPFAGRVSRLEADIEDAGWRTGTTYGGVMTSLAVHHLDAEGKRHFYRDVHAMLAPGGRFVMADLVEPTGATARKLAADHWARAVAVGSQERFGSDEASVAFDRAEWNYYLVEGPDPVDKPSSVIEHLDWLREAGFVEVDMAWMYAGHALFTATRKAD